MTRVRRGREEVRAAPWVSVLSKKIEKKITMKGLIAIIMKKNGSAGKGIEIYESKVRWNSIPVAIGVIRNTA